MSIKHLLTPMKLGAIEVKNRIFMAPLTRSRASQPGDVPAALNTLYYTQRAGSGLIITEATQVSKQGQGYAWTPGLYTDAQQAGWQQVVNSVHAAGGKIAVQLWHVGRISHSLHQENGAAPVAPSAIVAKNSYSFVVLPEGTPSNQLAELPRALNTDELPGIVSDYVASAKRAKAIGFDLVEIHSANGYLLNQFLDINANQRTDNYGGLMENRARLTLEVVDAVVAEFGADKVGIRLSPNGVFNDMTPAGSTEMALYLAAECQKRGLAYLHIAEPDWAGGIALTDEFRKVLRETFKGALIFCGGYTAEKAESLVAEGTADAVAFGRPYIANPDLAERFAKSAPLNTPNPDTFYGGAEKGYTDYPFMN